MAGLRPDIRAEATSALAMQTTLFPFDAWEFDDPNRVEEPDLTLKPPWALDGQTIRAGTITADKIVVGGISTGTAYNQPLAPNVVKIADTWIDSDDDQFHIPYGGEIDTSVGGAGADITDFEETIGVAGADVDTFDSVLGAIPSYAGWIQSAYVAGTTLIDGGMIETDSLKSANYVPGLAGSKFDLATGFIETSDGTFRGSLESADGTFTGALSAASGNFSGEFSTTTIVTSLGSSTPSSTEYTANNNEAVDIMTYLLSTGRGVGIKYACSGNYGAQTISAVEFELAYQYDYFVRFFDEADTLILSGDRSGTQYTIYKTVYIPFSAYGEDAVTITFTVGGDILKILGLPTTDAGLAENQVWRDGSGFLKIKL